MDKTKPAMVHCRYKNCKKLHESTGLAKEDAVMGGKSYYHPDCYHTMKTITRIRDLFVHNINPNIKGQHFGILVFTINNIVFDKKIEADYLLFALEYFIKNKPGKLNQPYGLHYIIENKEVMEAWDRRQKINVSTQTDCKFVYELPKQRSFEDILR